MLNGEKMDPKVQKVVFLCFSERCHGNMYNLNVIVVIEFIGSDLLFAILLSSKFKNSIFLQTHEATLGRNQALNSLGPKRSQMIQYCLECESTHVCSEYSEYIEYI